MYPCDILSSGYITPSAISYLSIKLIASSKAIASSSKKPHPPTMLTTLFYGILPPAIISFLVIRNSGFVPTAPFPPDIGLCNVFVVTSPLTLLANPFAPVERLHSL
jgi:hypothetical protein